MMFVLERMDLPPWFVGMVRVLYTKAATRIQFRGSEPVLVMLERGSRQGCPLSGILFVICFDPVLRYFKTQLVHPKADLTGFADNLA